MLYTELNRNCSALPSWKLAADTITQASGLENRLSFRSLAVGNTASSPGGQGPMRSHGSTLAAGVGSTLPEQTRPGEDPSSPARPAPHHSSLVLVPSDSFPSIPAPAISRVLPPLTGAGIGNVALDPNSRAKQKQPQDRDESLRQPRRSVSTDQMLFVIHEQLTNGWAARRRAASSPVAEFRRCL